MKRPKELLAEGLPRAFLVFGWRLWGAYADLQVCRERVSFTMCSRICQPHGHGRRRTDDIIRRQAETVVTFWLLLHSTKSQRFGSSPDGCVVDWRNETNKENLNERTKRRPVTYSVSRRTFWTNETPKNLKKRRKKKNGSRIVKKFLRPSTWPYLSSLFSLFVLVDVAH